MPTKGHLTGMRGVYLVAAELAAKGFIASPTSRSAYGADILVTDQACKKAWSVQVKTNAGKPNFWLLNARSKVAHSSTHVYVFVNLCNGKVAEFFVVPSKVVARDMTIGEAKTCSIWYSFFKDDAARYKDGWGLFGDAHTDIETKVSSKAA